MEQNYVTVTLSIPNFSGCVVCNFCSCMSLLAPSHSVGDKNLHRGKLFPARSVYIVFHLCEVVDVIYILI